MRSDTIYQVGKLSNHSFFIYVLVIRRRHLLIYYTNTVFADKAIHCRYATGICGSGEIPRQSGWPRATAEGLRNLCQTYRPNFSGRSGSRSTGTRRGSTIACAYICAYTYAPQYILGIRLLQKRVQAVAVPEKRLGVDDDDLCTGS